MMTMNDSSQNSISQRWKREQEEQRQYQLLRRRRNLQMERQHQRQRLVMAAMEQHERRRKRYQRALEQRQLSKRIDHHHHHIHESDASVVELDTMKMNKWATLETIKHQLGNYIQQWLYFLDQRSDTLTRWTLFKRLVILTVYEDTLMRLLLRLDGVSSDGDDGIRQQRKALVKRINGYLDQLDQHKQRYMGDGGI